MGQELISVRGQAFIDMLIAGQSIEKAGKLAGFSSPSRDVVPLVMQPAVRQYVRKRMRGRLELEGAPGAYALMYRTMMDEAQPRPLRIEIAKFLYATAGYTPPKASEAPDSDVNEKAPSEMTTDELKRFIQDGEKVLADRAKPVQEAQGIDSLM